MNPVATISNPEAAIQTQGLTKDYGASRGVFELDLEVRTGEILGFIGPNGAGKSTTMRVLLGLAQPTSGTARLLGRDMASEGLAIRTHTGYLAGDFGLYDQMTGGAILDYFSRLRGGVPAGRIAELADRFDAQLDRRVRELSTGNKQKLGLIQAFMHDPDLFILDEPIAGLDPLVQRNFHDLLGELRERGRTVMLSSHTLSEVDRVADRVAILRAGRRVASIYRCKFAGGLGSRLVSVCGGHLRGSGRRVCAGWVLDFGGSDRSRSSSGGAQKGLGRVGVQRLGCG